MNVYSIKSHLEAEDTKYWRLHGEHQDTASLRISSLLPVCICCFQTMHSVPENMLVTMVRPTWKKCNIFFFGFLQRMILSLREITNLFLHYSILI